MKRNKKRGYLGELPIDTNNYWTAGKETHKLKCNENLIYAELDCCNSYVTIATTKEELQKQYSRMDMFYMILKAIEQFGEDNNMLSKAGIVIGNMITEGYFSQNFETLDQENSFVVSSISVMYDRVTNYKETTRNENFLEYFNENILNQNFYRWTDGTKRNTPQLSGLGSTDEDFNKKIKNSGTYMLYLLSDATKLQGYDKKAITRKKLTQNKTLQYLAGCGNNMTTATLLKNCESGVVEKTGKSPDDALKQLRQEAIDKKNGVSGLGELFTIISIIIVAITIICRIITAVLEYQAAKLQSKATEALNANQAPSDSEVEEGAPDLEDWLNAMEEADDAQEEYNTQLENSSIWKKPVFWICSGVVGVASVVAVIFSKKKKNKNNNG